MPRFAPPNSRTKAQRARRPQRPEDAQRPQERQRQRGGGQPIGAQERQLGRGDHEAHREIDHERDPDRRHRPVQPEPLRRRLRRVREIGHEQHEEGDAEANHHRFGQGLPPLQQFRPLTGGAVGFAPVRRRRIVFPVRFDSPPLVHWSLP
jgi:hypothetical protein